MWRFWRKNEHVCSVPGVEIRLTVNGQPVVQGDSRWLHYTAKVGRDVGNDWYDLLNSEFAQFRPKDGSVIGLEIRPITTECE